MHAIGSAFSYIIENRQSHITRKIETNTAGKGVLNIIGKTQSNIIGNSSHKNKLHKFGSPRTKSVPRNDT